MLSLTLGCEVHGVSLHGIRCVPLIPVAAGVAVHVTMVTTWKRGTCEEEKLAHRESQTLTDSEDVATLNIPTLLLQ